jgi:F0F1-type ATP synthase membrane subunit c/vacuolar-type H+-ATPase subunit K
MGSGIAITVTSIISAVMSSGSFSLANVVSRNPEEAALRALLFIRSERLANELKGS